MNNGKLEENPALKMKLYKENNKRVRWLTEDEEKRLFAVIPMKYHPLVIVALDTGMRKGEQLSVKWSDVDFRLNQITVRESKNGRSRVIPMNDRVQETLRRLPRMINNP